MTGSSFCQVNSHNNRTNSHYNKLLNFPNDAINLSLYTLKNGLNLYVASKHDITRIKRTIIVKALRNQFKADSAGLARYLNWRHSQKLVEFIKHI